MLASAQGYASIVEAIIGARANINLKDGVSVYCSVYSIILLETKVQNIVFAFLLTYTYNTNVAFYFQ